MQPFDIEQVATELHKKYGWPRAKVCEEYDTKSLFIDTLYAHKAPGYYDEPFPTSVLNDWNEMGITVVECGDNNMGQLIAIVHQPDIKMDDLLP